MKTSKITKMVLALDSDIFLNCTTPKAELDALVQAKDDDTGKPMFESMYSHNNKMVRKITTLLNAAFTQKVQTFMLNRSTCVKLIKEDVNHDLSLGNSEYSRLLYFIANSCIFDVLRQPTNKKSGVYKITQPDLVKELHRLAAVEYFEAQEKVVLDFYENDTNNSTKKEIKPMTGKELAEKVRQDIKNKGLRYEQ